MLLEEKCFLRSPSSEASLSSPQTNIASKSSPPAMSASLLARNTLSPFHGFDFLLFFHFGFMIFTLIDCYNQVETVFHEFGHALQNMLTKQDEGLVSGSQGIQNDVVELTYQFMENWCCQRCSDTYSDTMLGYANSIRTIDGGTHIDGMKENDVSLSGEHVNEGLTCVISVKVANPKFEGQTK
ncbi:unnamed protein product [Camellia sinensis]